MISAVITGPTLNDAKRQLEKAKKASLFELRLDLFTNWSLEEIEALIKGKKVILTWKGEKTVYKRIASLNPAFIDIEREAFEAPFGFYPKEKTIVSTHNFQNTSFPKPLEGVIEKLAVTPKNFPDVIALLEWCQKGGKRIGVSLGEKGALSRVLGLKFSSLWSYAPVEGVCSPGQISFEELSHVNEKTELFGLIGDPVSQSIGHTYHNSVFQKTKRNAFYVKIPVTKEELPEAFHFLKNHFKGLSVTMPLKEAIFPLLEEKDTSSGAINTVKFIKKRSFGINTDGVGALDAIEAHIEVKGKRILLLGAGGAARAFVIEAKKRGANLFIHKDSSKRAIEFAKEFAIGVSSEEFDILVNATPEDFSQIVKPNTYVFDMRVSPRWTPFLLEAQSVGATPIFGEEMFFNQAKAQQSFWLKT
jgi:3-dehydroquinate dehydratase/shikimate dehydrogenase